MRARTVLALLSLATPIASAACDPHIARVSATSDAAHSLDANVDSHHDRDAGPTRDACVRPPTIGTVTGGKCGYSASDFECDAAYCDGADIEEPSADVLASRVFVEGTDAVVQALLAARPFSPDNANDFAVLFDVDNNPSTGQTGGDCNRQLWTFDAFVAIQPIVYG